MTETKKAAFWAAFQGIWSAREDLKSSFKIMILRIFYTDIYVKYAYGYA